MSFYSGKIIKETTKKSKIGFVLIGLIVLLLAGGVFVLTDKNLVSKVSLYRCYWDSSIITKPGPSATTLAPITITQGEEPLSIGKMLQDHGVISNAQNFLCYVRKIDAGNKIQAGYYEIQLPVTLEQLVPLLQSARIPTVRVTLQEGLRMDEIAAKIDTAMGTENTIKKFSKEEFLALTKDKAQIDSVPAAKGKSSLEGFLFPDTYEIEKNATTQDILTLLLKTFNKKVVDTSNLQAQKSLTPYQVVVLASILEKEAGKSMEEKQIIAGILEKRLTSGWLLQVDATFLYEKKDWKAPIMETDKTSVSPYNTYRFKGLPPTPICNPGLSSITAVLTPKESAYWFYLHGTDGVVHYAKDNAEHIRNIALYLR